MNAEPTSNAPGTTSLEVRRLRFDEQTLWVDFNDGRTLGVPLTWFPVLAAASVQEREEYWLSPGGLHWDGIDEDISVLGLLQGRGDMTHRGARRVSSTVAAE